jgi:hypothetical protein
MPYISTGYVPARTRLGAVMRHSQDKMFCRSVAAWGLRPARLPSPGPCGVGIDMQCIIMYRYKMPYDSVYTGMARFYPKASIVTISYVSEVPSPRRVIRPHPRWHANPQSGGRKIPRASRGVDAVNDINSSLCNADGGDHPRGAATLHARPGELANVLSACRIGAC